MCFSTKTSRWRHLPNLRLVSCSNTRGRHFFLLWNHVLRSDPPLGPRMTGEHTVSGCPWEGPTFLLLETILRTLRHSRAAPAPATKQNRPGVQSRRLLLLCLFYRRLPESWDKLTDISSRALVTRVGTKTGSDAAVCYKRLELICLILLFRTPILLKRVLQPHGGGSDRIHVLKILYLTVFSRSGCKTHFSSGSTVQLNPKWFRTNNR